MTRDDLRAELVGSIIALAAYLHENDTAEDKDFVCQKIVELVGEYQKQVASV